MASPSPPPSTDATTFDDLPREAQLLVLRLALFRDLEEVKVEEEDNHNVGRCQLTQVFLQL